ncbi:unnamed protein product [Cyprideis torosa]|uniref:Uncharacterized protein n=1 Tax=Cyprideis torosa TaxID=163714 RepID=A0A7R8ZNI3_9CRUS|nr:unnamed protein product [Cyprideis torosa]CAG0886427.1 unnamed protein product [Cyprideis torosa]
MEPRRRARRIRVKKSSWNDDDDDFVGPLANNTGGLKRNESSSSSLKFPQPAPAPARGTLSRRQTLGSSGSVNTGRESSRSRSREISSRAGLQVKASFSTVTTRQPPVKTSRPWNGGPGVACKSSSSSTRLAAGTSRAAVELSTTSDLAKPTNSDAPLASSAVYEKTRRNAASKAESFAAEHKKPIVEKLFSSAKKIISSGKKKACATGGDGFRAPAPLLGREVPKLVFHSSSSESLADSAKENTEPAETDAEANAEAVNDLGLLPPRERLRNPSASALTPGAAMAGAALLQPRSRKIPGRLGAMPMRSVWPDSAKRFPAHIGKLSSSVSTPSLSTVATSKSTKTPQVLTAEGKGTGTSASLSRSNSLGSVAGHHPEGVSTVKKRPFPLENGRTKLGNRLAVLHEESSSGSGGSGRHRHHSMTTTPGHKHSTARPDVHHDLQHHPIKSFAHQGPDFIHPIQGDSPSFTSACAKSKQQHPPESAPVSQAFDIPRQPPESASLPQALYINPLSQVPDRSRPQQPPPAQLFTTGPFGPAGTDHSCSISPILLESVENSNNKESQEMEASDEGIGCSFKALPLLSDSLNNGTFKGGLDDFSVATEEILRKFGEGTIETLRSQPQHHRKQHHPPSQATSTLSTFSTPFSSSTMTPAPSQSFAPPVLFSTAAAYPTPSLQPPLAAHFPCQQLIIKGKPYIKLNAIGKGGSCEVYQVWDCEGGRILALKNVVTRDRDTIRGFMGEVQLLEKLQCCSRVIKMFDYDCSPNANALMVLLEKGETDFASKLKSAGLTGSFPIRGIKIFWEQMLQTVHQIHDQGVIHADLKPANFLLVNGELKLIDFGIACSLKDADATSVTLPCLMGTYNYISPEALMGTGAPTVAGQMPVIKISRKSDIWSLGCILYHMAFGRPPFGNVTQLPAKFRAITDPSIPIPIPEERQNTRLADVILKCLQRDPKLRPTTEELLQDPYLVTSPWN